MGLFSAPEFKVGLLVLIVSGLIAGMSIKVSNDPAGLGSSKEAFFYMDDASGLVKNSNIRMAGIPVGMIKDIKLENGMARVEVILKGDTPVTKSARVEIRPNGILGDKFVEVIGGDVRDPPLRSGDQIMVVDDRASVDRMIGEISKITKSISQVAENIKSATEGDKDKPLGRIIDNLERITTDISTITSGHRDDVGEIIANLRDTTDTINNLVNDDSSEGFKAAWQDAMRSLKKIEGSLNNLEEITGKINRGEGTIGKLINDPDTVEELNTAISGINSMLDSSNKLQTSLDYHSHFMTDTGKAKSYVSLRLQPGIDRYYEIGVVDDARGSRERTTITSTTGGVSTVTQEEKSYRDRVKFNALFAKNFWNLTLKGGILENTGGLGADIYMLKRDLRFSFEAFDFSNVQLRASARYNLWSGLYVVAGGENLAGTSSSAEVASKATVFVGGGLFLTNDDLKLLLTKLPF
ncbi:MAG: MlaD family protein [Bdellovibrionales bacterium]|jgi:phospholipid/cholesterol/gamma-HCH transport system substrate-binding protein|nr:MlaD family protein [Bdellovibrionales bacterium]